MSIESILGSCLSIAIILGVAYLGFSRLVLILNKGFETLTREIESNNLQIAELRNALAGNESRIQTQLSDVQLLTESLREEIYGQQQMIAIMNLETRIEEIFNETIGQRTSLLNELVKLKDEMKCKYFHGIQHNHLRVKDRDLNDLLRGCNQRVINGIFFSNRQDIPCIFKVVKQEDEILRSRLHKEKDILLELQKQPGGSKYHGMCLSEQLEWNQDQDFYTLSSETGWIVVHSEPKLYGLVLEARGKDLSTFLSHRDQVFSRFGIIPRVNILRDIVAALKFLEERGIIHGDLKPENIVSFQSSEATSWKLINFDSSYNLHDIPSPKIDPGNLSATPAYISPEVAQAVMDQILLDPTHKMDIWSLGLVSIFVLTGQSHWNLYQPFCSLGRETQSLRLANLGPIIDFPEEHFNRNWLSSQVGEKEKSFIQSCMRVDPSARSSASDLENKSLFYTAQSTISSWDNQYLKRILDDINGLNESISILPHDDRFRDALMTVSSALERIIS